MKKMPQDVKNINNRIRKLKAFEEHVQKDPTETKFVYAYQIGSRIGTELVAGILVGAGIGYFLDKIFTTSPTLLVIFLILGGAAGFLNVYRFIKKEESRKE